MRKYWCPVCEKPVPADQLAVNVGDKVNITIEHTKITPSRTTVRVVTGSGKWLVLKMISLPLLIAARFTG